MTYFLDLFAGIGGFSLGAYWAGLRFDAHYFSEVDDYAIRVYQQRFPDAVPLGDIRDIRGADLPEGEWIIAGGFPCQDISVAGKGAGLAGERSGLWYEYARLIGELRPRYAIMENVGALAFRGLDSVLGSLAEIGYDAEWQDIRASDVGAPHRRERVWIVAYPNESPIPDSERIRRGSGRTRGPYCGGKREAEQPFQLADTSRELSHRSGETRGRGPESTNSGEAISHPDRTGLEERYRSGSRRSFTAAVIGNWWSTEPDVGRVAHGVPARVDRLKCLGNSIVPQIAQLIFEQAAFDEWRAAA